MSQIMLFRIACTHITAIGSQCPNKFGSIVWTHPHTNAIGGRIWYK